ncbi:hypothetical protein L596_008138 [Steinernema carpocapsae]|uniref:Uncharacterized protein n=1 Tax=Steinernema carpocapsae TaxID=34508 RepID=A0A4U5PCK6_STECR|nr:hypothetical protein L596_008138 [Steinernema carpocapsae]
MPEIRLHFTSTADAVGRTSVPPTLEVDQLSFSQRRPLAQSQADQLSVGCVTLQLAPCCGCKVCRIEMIILPQSHVTSI